MVKKYVAIIPARGGSKRIKNKNIIELNGLPLIVWTIKAAIAANVFDRILISTDDPRIALICESYGVAVPFLREIGFDDVTPVSIATIATLKKAEEYYNEEYENIVQLLPTSPLRGSDEIVSAINLYEKLNSKSLISVVDITSVNPWWAFKVDSNKKAKFIHRSKLTKRSQDLPKLYSPTGAIWISRNYELKKNKSFYGKAFDIFIIDHLTGLDIDTQNDIILAEFLLSHTEDPKFRKLKDSIASDLI
jgi:CMP-N-acetylneuraminic acid synthetase